MGSPLSSWSGEASGCVHGAVDTRPHRQPAVLYSCWGRGRQLTQKAGSSPERPSNTGVPRCGASGIFLVNNNRFRFTD